MVLDQQQAKRYVRHFALKEIGISGQKKLLSSKVLVIGAGGLGSPAIMYLTAAGVGTLGIADFDTVDCSNLQRQIIHNTETLGMPKTISAEKAAKAINPDIIIKRYDFPLTSDNIIPIITEYDFILDCTDRFETKFLINDACVLSEKPYTHAGVVRFEGQAMTYVPQKGPCLRCLMGDVPHDAATCKDVGVIGAAVGVLGSIQALEAVKYITGAGELLCGKILTFDGLTMNMRVHSVPHADPECAVCGKTPKIKNLSDNNSDYQIPSCQTGGETI